MEVGDAAVRQREVVDIGVSVPVIKVAEGDVGIVES